MKTLYESILEQLPVKPGNKLFVVNKNINKIITYATIGIEIYDKHISIVASQIPQEAAYPDHFDMNMLNDTIFTDKKLANKRLNELNIGGMS